MVANFTKLHQNVRNLLVHSRVQGISCVSAVHELVVEIPLPLRQWTHHDMLIFVWKFLFHVPFQASENVRPEDGMQLIDSLLGRIVEDGAILDGLFERVWEKNKTTNSKKNILEGLTREPISKLFELYEL
jgi:hypothetical protein